MWSQQQSPTRSGGEPGIVAGLAETDGEKFVVRSTRVTRLTSASLGLRPRSGHPHQTSLEPSRDGHAVPERPLLTVNSYPVPHVRPTCCSIRQIAMWRHTDLPVQSHRRSFRPVLPRSRNVFSNLAHSPLPSLYRRGHDHGHLRGQEDRLPFGVVSLKSGISYGSILPLQAWAREREVQLPLATLPIY